MVSEPPTGANYLLVESKAERGMPLVGNAVPSSLLPPQSASCPLGLSRRVKALVFKKVVVQ